MLRALSIALLLSLLVGCDSAEPEPPADLVPSQWFGFAGLSIDRSVHIEDLDTTFTWNDEFTQNYRLELTEPLDSEAYDYKGTLRVRDYGLARDVPITTEDGTVELIDIRIDATETYVVRVTWESGSPHPSLVLNVGEVASTGSSYPSPPFRTQAFELRGDTTLQATVRVGGIGIPEEYRVPYVVVLNRAEPQG